MTGTEWRTFFCISLLLLLLLLFFFVVVDVLVLVLFCLLETFQLTCCLFCVFVFLCFCVFVFSLFTKKTEGRSKESKDLVRRLLSKRHAERPTCDQALEHSWFTDLQAQLRVRSNPDNIANLAKVKYFFVFFSFWFFVEQTLTLYYNAAVLPLLSRPFPFLLLFLFFLFLFLSFLSSKGW